MNRFLKRLHPLTTAILVLVLHSVSIKLPSHGWYFVASLVLGCLSGWLLGILAIDTDRWRTSQVAAQAAKPVSAKEMAAYFTAMDALDAKRPDRNRAIITGVHS